MRILIHGENDEGYIAKFHEGFKWGLRRVLDAKCYGPGYPGYDESKRTYQEVLDQVFPGDNRDVVLLASFHLTQSFEGLRFKLDGIESLPNPKAMILSDFWNITEHYPKEYPGWILKNGIDAILCQYPYPIKLYAGTPIADRMAHIPICIDPEIMNDWGVPKQFDVGFIGAGVTDPHPFYPERFRIHQRLSAMPGLKYLVAPHPGYDPIPDSHPLAGRNFSKCIGACRMFVVTGSRYNNPFGKYFEVMASRTLLLGIEPEWADDIHFRDGVNYVRITEEDVADKVKYYLARPDVCDRIAQAGYETAMKHHTIYARAADVLSALASRIRAKTQPSLPAVKNGAESFEMVMPFTEPEMMAKFHGPGSFWKHLPTIYAMAIGLRAQKIIDLGIGSTTRALRLAATHTGGVVHSCDIDARRYGHFAALQDETWKFTLSPSGPFLRTLEGPIDFVMHDAAHDYAQVKEDIGILLPKMRTFGIICVHDTQQPEFNPQLIEAIADATRGFPVSLTTLPYSCGLTIIRIEKGAYPFIPGGAKLPDGRWNTEVFPHPMVFLQDAHRAQPAVPAAASPANHPIPDVRPLRLNVGCRGQKLPGWVNIDAAAPADLQCATLDFPDRFKAGTVEEIWLNHNLPGLTLWEARDLLSRCRSLLAPGGRIRIDFSDAAKAAKRVVETVGKDFDSYLEGVRALPGFGLDHLAQRREYSAAKMVWSGWHLAAELRKAGFDQVKVDDAEPPNAWRDTRVTAVRGA